MADTRSRRAKLQAIIAADSGASDGERANARALLEKLDDRRPSPRTARQRSFTRSKVWVEVDDFLKGYQRPGFSNAGRPGRPVVDVHEPDRNLSRDDVRRIESNGATVGTLQFGDALGAGAGPRIPAGTKVADAVRQLLEEPEPIQLGPGEFDKEP